MAKLRFPFLAATLCMAGAAIAQTSPAAPSPVGPFPPQPGDDPSLFRTLPPEAYATPTEPRAAHAAPQPPAANPAAVAAPPAPIVVVVPDHRSQAAEQLDRAQLEADAARARMSQAPAPINGAFTGLTDERDR